MNALGHCWLIGPTLQRIAIDEGRLTVKPLGRNRPKSPDKFPRDAWIESFLQKGTLPVPYSIKYPNRCLSEHLQADALKFDRYINESNLVAKLKKVFGKDNMKDFNNQVARGWIFPPLADCRQRWEQRYGGKWNWHHDIKEWRLPSC